MKTFRPILLNSCARAATAEEMRYRIDRPIVAERGVRVVALDAAAAQVVADAAAGQWNAARFFVGAHAAPAGDGRASADVCLRAADGSESFLSDELEGAHIVVLVAGDEGGRDTAAVIGRACARLEVMTAGVILGGADRADDTVAALRPHARVLLITGDDQDVSELLSALRA